MILVVAALGIFVGSALNWAAVWVVRSSSRKPAANPVFELAIVRWLWSIRTERNSLEPRPHRQNAVAELLCGLLFAYLWTRYGLSFDALRMVSVGCFLILIAIIDQRYRLIPNALVFPAAALTLLFHLMTPGTNMIAVLLGGMFGLMTFGCVALLRPEGLGMGDVKLAALIGLFFGFPDALWALTAGVIAGGIATFFLLLSRHSRMSQIPYAPYLCLGALIALFYNPFAALFYSAMGR